MKSPAIEWGFLFYVLKNLGLDVLSFKRSKLIFEVFVCCEQSYYESIKILNNPNLLVSPTTSPPEYDHNNHLPTEDERER